MFRGRILIFFFLVFLVVSIPAYYLLDFRDRDEILLDLYKSGNYSKALQLYSKDEIPETDSEVLALSLSVSGLEGELNSPNKAKLALSKVQKLPQLQIQEWKVNQVSYLHLLDPYFPYLKKHSSAYKKALTGKIRTFRRDIPSDKALSYLKLLLVEDPRGVERVFSEALAKLLQIPGHLLLSHELRFLDQVLHYLASSEGNLFFEGLHRVRGSQVNLRSGPGKENPELGQAENQEPAFCFEADSREETLAGMTSSWRNCFFPNRKKSAWVFGGFLQPEEPDLTKSQELFQRFKEIDNEIKIDFSGWSGEKPPPTFHGKYLPRKPVLIYGEPGFSIPLSRLGQYERICKKLSGEKNYFEFSFYPPEGKELIPLFEIELVYAGKSHKAYTVSSSESLISVNKVNHSLGSEEKKRENFSLHIEGKEGSNLVGSLWRRNAGLLQSLKSLPLDEIVLEKGRYSWEVCLPIALAPEKREVVLFEIRTGVH